MLLSSTFRQLKKNHQKSLWWFQVRWRSHRQPKTCAVSGDAGRKDREIFSRVAGAAKNPKNANESRLCGPELTFARGPFCHAGRLSIACAPTYDSAARDEPAT